MLIAASAAQAETTPADPLRAFEATVARAKNEGEQRFAFTMGYTDLAKNPDKTYVVRFDPNLPVGARFTPIDPPPAALTRDERKALEKLSADNDADGALVYDGLADEIETPTIESETASAAVFRLALDGPDMAAEMRDAIEARATLDRAGGYVSEIEIRSIKPFKPAAIARIATMRQSQRFAPVGPNGLPILIEARSSVEGKAMLKSFRQDVKITYSDFVAVNAPPREKKASGEK